MGTGGWRRAFCTSVGVDPDTTVATRREAGERQQLSPSTRSCAKLIFFSGGGRGGSNPSTPRLDEGLRCRTRAMSPDRPKLQCETPVGVTPTLSIGTPNPRSRSPALFRRKAFSAPSSPRSPSRFGLFKHRSSVCKLFYSCCLVFSPSSLVLSVFVDLFKRFGLSLSRWLVAMRESAVVRSLIAE